MITGMTNEESASFLEDISATVIANQAVLKCCLSGFPLTVENAILFVGNFIDPENPQMRGLIGKIEAAIEDVVKCYPGSLFGAGPVRHS